MSDEPTGHELLWIGGVLVAFIGLSVAIAASAAAIVHQAADGTAVFGFVEEIGAGAATLVGGIFPLLAVVGGTALRWNSYDHGGAGPVMGALVLSLWVLVANLLVTTLGAPAAVWITIVVLGAGTAFVALSKRTVPW